MSLQQKTTSAAVPDLIAEIRKQENQISSLTIELQDLQKQNEELLKLEKEAITLKEENERLTKENNLLNYKLETSEELSNTIKKEIENIKNEVNKITNNIKVDDLQNISKNLISCGNEAVKTTKECKSVNSAILKNWALILGLVGCVIYSYLQFDYTIKQKTSNIWHKLDSIEQLLIKQ